MLSGLLIVLLAALSAQDSRWTEPVFDGQGEGRLIVLEVPQDTPLEFYSVQCIEAGPAGPVFSVTRSGEKGEPRKTAVGETYVDASRGVSFRLEQGPRAFAVGDTFRFVAYGDEERLEKVLERWVDQYVKWIISREERERFEQLDSPEDKLGFIEFFWRRRDPDPGTPENEARQEHARRFAYAVRHFGAGTPGWATDRGKIYIVLGPPHAIERNPAGRTAFERPSEIWTYNNLPNPKLPASLDIGFVDFTGTGRFEIVDASNLDIVAPLRTNIGYAMSELEAIGLLRSGGTLMDQTTGFRTVVRPTELTSAQFEFQRELREVAKIPELNLPSLRGVIESRADFPSLPVAVDTAFVRADERSGLVPVTVSVPYARLTPQASGSGYRYTADVLLRVTSGEEEAHEPIEDRIEVDVAAGDLEKYRESELLYEASLLLPPGRYRVDALVRDNPSGTLGTGESSIEVEALADDSLRLSSLILARDAVETGLPPSETPRRAFQFGSIRIIPNVKNVFPSGGELVAYCQAYGFARDEEGAPHLKVEFFLLRQGRLFSKVEPSYHATSGRTQLAIMSKISLAAFAPGEYELLLRVTDERNGASAERRAPFSVSR